MNPLDNRPEPPSQADEWATLNGFLDHLRATVRWKVADLGPGQLMQTHPPSKLTMIGLVRHLAYVEDVWSNVVLWGGKPVPPWDGVDWDVDGDWEFDSALVEPPEASFELWHTAVDRSRDLIAAAHAEGGMERLAEGSRPDGLRPNVRWILVHLIEEYSRHCGHLDLLRESIDGRVGE
ncbi:DinB family protein [Naumannella halotolerans]|uniref:DinB family protein n=1 Tax=Naumannella halotolerans TaxID=993414 RepID=UPI00370DD5E3